MANTIDTLALAAVLYSERPTSDRPKKVGGGASGALWAQWESTVETVSLLLGSPAERQAFQRACGLSGAPLAPADEVVILVGCPSIGIKAERTNRRGDCDHPECGRLKTAPVWRLTIAGDRRVEEVAACDEHLEGIVEVAYDGEVIFESSK